MSEVPDLGDLELFLHDTRPSARPTALILFGLIHQVGKTLEEVAAVVGAR